MLDDEGSDGAFGRDEFKAELFLQGGEEVGRAIGGAVIGVL